MVNGAVKVRPLCFGFIVLSLAVFCALGMLIFWRADPTNVRAWSDQRLIDCFREHKAQFVLLREMAAADMPDSAYLNASGDNPKLNRDKNRQYRELMSEIDHSLIIGMDYDTTTRFVFSSGGLSAIGPGWLKGIEYIPADPERKGQIVPNLDGAQKLPADVYLREIEPHWFIVYQHTDD